MTNNESKAKLIIGKVISDKMQKTIVVLVDRTIKHPKYDKIIKKTSKFHVHDENEVAKIGDMVAIKEWKPISKTKNWILVDVVS